MEKFQDPNICYIELAEHYFVDDCRALGFEMDCGHAFGERYGNAVKSADALRKVIDEISDISECDDLALLDLIYKLIVTSKSE